MFFDILGWMIHYTLYHIGVIWFILTIVLCLISAAIAFAVGAIRWWRVKYTKLPKMWAKHRRELNKVIEEQNSIIEQKDKELHFYKHCAYVGAVMKLQDEAEKENEI